MHIICFMPWFAHGVGESVNVSGYYPKKYDATFEEIGLDTREDDYWIRSGYDGDFFRDLIMYPQPDIKT